MKERRRRRIDPQAAQRAAGAGWYQDFTPTLRDLIPCGKCGTGWALVARAGEWCLLCRLEAKKATREIPADSTPGPF